MAAFLYKAVDASGRGSSGVVEAASAAAARQALRARALLPLTVEPAADAGGARRSGGFALGRRGGLSWRTLTVVTRQLATLVGAGVRVEDALKTIADQTGQPRATSLLLTLRAAVLEGHSLASALDQHPESFGTFYRASVRAGETSGQLGQVLEHLADFVEKRARTRRTVQLALLYPAILGVVSLAVIVGLLVFVVPDIVRVFTSRGAELPFLTRSLIGLSEAVVRFGPASALGLMLGGLAINWALARPAIRTAWHRWLTRAWPVRHFVLKSNAVHYAGTLATLTVSRVPLSEALDASAATVANLHIREAAVQVAARVREGTALSVAMRQTGLFPPMLIAMVASGEAGGTLGASLSRAANDQARDLEELVAALVALVEPAVLLVMGGIVMLLVLSILLPISNLNNLVG